MGCTIFPAETFEIYHTVPAILRVLLNGCCGRGQRFRVQALACGFAIGSLKAEL
jgi:hypothetical protein